MTGITYLQPKKVLSICTDIVSLYSSVVWFSGSPGLTIPALFTSTSMRPYFFSVSLIISIHRSSSVTSCLKKVPPNLSARACPLSSAISVKTTLAPSEAKSSASAAPRPIAAPVIIATFPSNLPVILFLHF